MLLADGRRVARGIAALWLVIFGSCAESCAAHKDQGRAADGQSPLNPACAPDQVREYFCDDLLPLTSTSPAPPPYENCPGTVAHRPTAFKSLSTQASFDPPFTEYTRRRVAPGHACCYGVCTAVAIAPASGAKPQACADRYAMPETFIMRETESGTSEPAAAPFDRCPSAIKPPESGAFAVPEAALLNPVETATRRQQIRLADCVYTWCSKAPVGTVLTQPKTR
jgi:hypothetical protein